MPPRNADARILEIEGLRGVLSLVVLLGHARALDSPWALSGALLGGAMETFFTISGFLITNIILTRAQCSSNFYSTYFVRRLLRIWPLYFTVLLVCCLLSLLLSRIGSHTMTWPALALSLTFTQNIELLPGNLTAQGNAWFPGYPFAFSHAWSVAVEEQFYLLAAFTVPTLLRRNSKLAGYMAILLMSLPLISLVLRVYGAHPWLLIARTDGFVFGGVLALLLHHSSLLDCSVSAALPSSNTLVRWALAIGATIVIAYVVARYVSGEPAPWWGEGFSATSLTFGVVNTGLAVLAFGIVGYLLVNAGGTKTAGMRSPWLVHLGRISYSTYLWHIPVFACGKIAFPQYLGVAQEFALLTAAPLALALSHFSYYLIEEPFLKFGRRLNYSDRIHLKWQEARETITAN